jgi:HAD superfamily hydrolase (TIGR01509 family)
MAAPRPEPPLGVIFDLDGLLVDSEPLQVLSFRKVMEEHGIDLTDEDFEAMVGFHTRDNFRYVREKYGLERSVESLLSAKDAAYRDIITAQMRTCRGADELVAALHARGVPMAVASSSPRRDVLLSLDTVRLTRFFTVIATADDVRETKPAPDLYLLAQQRIGVPARRCVAFEDAGPGLQAALAAGLLCIAVPHRFTAKHDFSRAARVLDSLSQISVDDLLELVARGDRSPL